MLKKLLLLFFVLAFVNLQYSSGQNYFYDTLQKNKIPFEFENLSSILSSTQNFPDKKFFLFGELHSTNANLELQYEFIKHLHKEKGINNIIIEMPHSEVYFFQKYLETGDTLLLYDYDGRINKRFLDKIREFNKNIDNPIRLFGIDLDIQFRNYFYADCIIHLANKHHYSDSISVLGKAINQLIWNRYNSVKLSEINEIIKQELNSNDTEFISLFGKDYLHLKTIVYSLKKDKGRRDDEMYENFKNLYKIWFPKDYDEIGFLAFFGGSHTYSENKRSFYHLLQNDNTSPVINNVSLSVIQYVNCQSSQFGRNPKYLIQIYNDGFFRGNNSTYKKLIRNDFLDAIELICTTDTKSNYLIPAYSDKPFFRWNKRNKLLTTIDILFIIQNSPPTHPVIQSLQ
ncbi:MAG TPA: hypothetical protein VFG10_04015 [Saprospiraceae bacterium]|nr:hypothetical protein [Saprospiraceae bacterium]